MQQLKAQRRREGKERKGKERKGKEERKEGIIFKILFLPVPFTSNSINLSF